MQFYTLSRLFVSDLIGKLQSGDQEIEPGRKMKTGSTHGIKKKKEKTR